MKRSLAPLIFAAVTAITSLTTACSKSAEPISSEVANVEAAERSGHSDPSEMEGEPIGGLLYGRYVSYEGKIAQLKLNLTEPVTFTRVDRVGDGETSIVRGVWDLAHHRVSGQKVIRFYDGDFSPIDEYAYSIDGDVLTLTHDGSGTQLWWSEPLRSTEGGRCSTTDKSLACEEGGGLECRDDVCVAGGGAEQ